MIKLSDKVTIDTIDFASQGNAILGIRGSGKTYTGTYLAERLMDEKIPIIVFDPIGIWRYLKVGEKGKGYPVVVAGDNGDLPLTATNATDIVKAAMKENISLIVDLYSIHLSKNDWRKIVENCLRELLYHNKTYGLRHIFIEEAAEFCPQRIRPEDGRVYAEVEKLARMGGNASLGYTLINQRAEEVNKAVLELCDCLFLHRQKGRHSLTALGKWLDVADASNSKQIINSLPMLEAGECWVWSQGSQLPVKVKIPKKSTVHPDRKNPLKLAPGAAVDVSKFVEQLNKSLSKPVEKTEAKPQFSSKAIEIAKSEIRREYEGKIKELVNENRKLKAVFEKISALVSINSAEVSYKIDTKIDVNGIERISAKAAHEIIRPSNTESSSLPPGEMKILKAAAQYDNGAVRDQLTVLTGYKRSSRDAYIQRLMQKGYMEIDNGRILATKSGIKALGSNFEPLPTGEALQQYWLEKLPAGEAKILDVLLDAHPGGVNRERISERTGYMRSSRDAYLQRMSAKEIIVVEAKGVVRASDSLF